MFVVKYDVVGKINLCGVLLLIFFIDVDYWIYSLYRLFRFIVEKFLNENIFFFCRYVVYIFRFLVRFSRCVWDFFFLVKCVYFYVLIDLSINEWKYIIIFFNWKL